MLVQPFGGSEPTAEVFDGVTVQRESSTDLIGCLIALIAALFAALAVVYLRKLADQVHFTVVPMYNLLGATLLSPIWSIIAPVKTVDALP